VTVPPGDDLAVLAEVQGVLIEVLETRNSELSAQVAGLEERLARLERLVSRNSGNSSMPPSADDLPGRKGLAGGNAAEAGNGRVSSPVRRVRTSPGGTTRMTRCRRSRPGPASAAVTLRMPMAWGFPGRGR
jgi:hypothetical protein